MAKLHCCEYSIWNGRMKDEVIVVHETVRLKKEKRKRVYEYKDRCNPISTFSVASGFKICVSISVCLRIRFD